MLRVNIGINGLADIEKSSVNSQCSLASYTVAHNTPEHVLFLNVNKQRMLSSSH